MALQFNPPNVNQPDKYQALNQTLGQTISTLPQMWAQYRMLRKKQSIEDLELDMKRRELEAKYGSGAPAPTLQPSPTSPLNPNPMGQPGDLGSAGSTLNAGLAPESKESLLARVGTEGVKLLGKDPESEDKTFDQENKIRSQFLEKTKEFPVVRNSYRRILDSAKEPSGAGDLALIFNYMKVLDPGSTVREGEFANAQNSAGVDERVRGLYNKVIRGERLSDNQRNDFVQRATKLYKGQEDLYKQDLGKFRELAKSYNLDPDQATLNLIADGLEAPSPTMNVAGGNNDPLGIR